MTNIDKCNSVSTNTCCIKHAVENRIRSLFDAVAITELKVCDRAQGYVVIVVAYDALVVDVVVYSELANLFGTDLRNITVRHQLLVSGCPCCQEGGLFGLNIDIKTGANWYTLEKNLSSMPCFDITHASDELTYVEDKYAAAANWAEEHNKRAAEQLQHVKLLNLTRANEDVVFNYIRELYTKNYNKSRRTFAENISKLQSRLRGVLFGFWKIGSLGENEAETLKLWLKHTQSFIADNKNAAMIGALIFQVEKQQEHDNRQE